MSVKQIGIHIKAKLKIHDNLDHKEHNTRFLHPRSLFKFSTSFNIPLSSKRHTSPSRHTHTDACEKNKNVSCIASNISAVR